MENKQNTEKGVYLNGKQQVIDLLKALEPAERERLLRGIKTRNPQMARELSEGAVSFQQLFQSTDQTIEKIFSSFEAPIVALSIKFTPDSFQRKVLRNIPRKLAEQAYQLLQKITHQKHNACLKAQDRVVQAALSLKKQGLISF